MLAVVVVATAASDQSGTAWWLPIVTFVGGAVLTLAAAYLQALTARADRGQAAADRRQDRAEERAARQEERRQELADEYRARQRDALTELQEQLSGFMRLIGRAHHADEMGWKQAGEPKDQYPVGPLPEGLGEEINGVQRRLQVLRERVDDAAVRASVSDFIHTGNAVIPAAGDHAATNAAFGQFAAAFQPLNEQIGSMLRTLPNG
jgi:hypothetical protein